MDRRDYLIVIRLKSDLCPGSGYAYAGIVDSDVCYDSYGIPCLPGRRLKGCLREAAELIGLTETERDTLFGKSGDNEVRGIRIGNAYIDRYQEIRRDLESLDPILRKHITPQNILDQFTTVRAQTKIGENGVSDDNSLRFIRTVNHYLPKELGGTEMCLKAEVVMPDTIGRDLLEKFAMTVKAVRLIGMNRNRGMGSVRCGLEPDPFLEEEKKENWTLDTEMVENADQNNPAVQCIYLSDGQIADRNLDDHAEYILRYTIRNTAPLIMSGEKDYKTEKYISGRSVMGFFAGCYIKETGQGGDGEEFADLFLKNRVRFGALYPAEKAYDRKYGTEDDRPFEETDGIETDVYYPAPAFIHRLKKTKCYVNVSKIIHNDAKKCEEFGIGTEYAAGNGNQPKRLRGKFVCLKEDGILLKEPAEDIIYHHTKKSKKQGNREGELLYTTEALREQQIFVGELAGNGKAIGILAALLQKYPLRFGKSKGTQYGTCVLDVEPVIQKVVKRNRVYKADSRILAVLESDGIFVNDCGYTVRCEEVRDQIRNCLGIERKESVSRNAEEGVYTELETGVLTGYYAKWNLHRQAVPVVKAGSTFEFYLTEDLNTYTDVFWVGENTGEGFGRLHLIENKWEDCRMKLAQKEDFLPVKPRYTGKLLQKMILDEVWERLKLNAVKSELHFPNAASLGRVTMMLAGSLDAYPDDAKESYHDFVRRIASIKTDNVRRKAESILIKWIGDVCKSSLKYSSLAEDLKILYDGLSQNESFEEAMEKLWGRYLMEMLIQEKYNLKHREIGNEEN